MCVPGSPAGCGPSNSARRNLPSWTSGPDQSGPVHKYTAPSVNCATTRRPLTKASRWSSMTMRGLAESGRVSIAVTNIERGLSVDLGTRLKGRVRSAAHAPDSSSCARTTSGPIEVSDAGSWARNDRAAASASSNSMTTDCSDRRRPRLIALTRPLPGATNFTAGSCLSSHSGSPSETRSPTSTSMRGFRPT